MESLEAILNIIKKFKEILTLKSLGAFGLVCLLFGYLGADGLFGLLYFKELLFIGAICIAIILFSFLTSLASWVKKNYREKLKRSQEQANIEYYASIIKNLDETQFNIIEKMLSSSINEFKEEYENYSEHSEFQKAKQEIFSQFKIKRIGGYMSSEGVRLGTYSIFFEIYPKVWKILMELYTSQPELFDRPDE